MMNSREVVELINVQMSTISNIEVKKALIEIVNQIKILEETELSDMYTKYEREEKEKVARIKRLGSELAAMFN